ncbi:N-acetylmuramoyl-L-alanine amidase [Algiphilus sp. NNCM1]|uniref:N-acetylmuramoyl-L-alanine amidase n=1 Tax=Algiphilus sp. TaxID=1872431 RepID=UPI001CA664CA|nr:N-acetylmuramoyl-L-alanine amidase [Algiphilus sp.]MBY8966923.1 N-acetylmuramoyl-L-alanine amidase [Algiphilus acroporae]MCI5103579.1 N-acetylmuramoyl-L-alanine amidase [Algiphilus sp.]
MNRLAAVRNGVGAWRVAMAMTLLCASAQAAELRDVRVWDGPHNTRVVFDLSDAAGHQVFTLENPARVVIDLADIGSSALDPNEVGGEGLLRGMRSARQPDGRLRVVLDLERSARTSSFALSPQAQYGHRIVVDLQPDVADAERERSSTPPSGAAASSAEEAALQQPAARLEQKHIIIAIDAGHGGEDPGALGPSGLKEKDVVLSISRRLADLVNAEPGFKAVMIRRGDYYIGLRERVRKARAAQADLFVSIHANGFTDSRVRGSSVYTLSPNGASSEQARWLAKRENEADLVGGIELADKEDTLAHVLLDISQSAAIEASVDAGKRVLQSLGQLNKLQRGDVQRAGFMVLKAPDIPSMLVETAFITNPGEERKLGSGAFQQRIADSIFEGIHSYFENYRPLRYVDARGGATTAALATDRHTVQRGDTLSELAQRYRTDSQRLRQVNDLDSDMLRVGQVLQIP